MTKKWIILFCFFTGFGQFAHAQNSIITAKGSVSGTLPSDIYRIRVIHQSLFGSQGFNNYWQWQSPGIEASVQAMGIAVDMPLWSDKVTLGIGLPFVYKNKASFDADLFAESSLFDSPYQKAKSAFIDKLVAIGECADRSICDARIERGDSIPVDVKVNLPDTNELYILPAFKPMKTAITELVKTGAQQGSGAVGIGDLELGLRYQWLPFAQTNNIYQSALQFGLKLPTGKYTNVTQSERSIGRGIVEAQLSIAGDVNLLPALSISGLYGLGFTVLNGKKRTSLILNNSRLASGKCDTPGEGNNWDGECQTLNVNKTVTRNDLHHQILLQANIDFGLFDKSFRAWGLSFGLFHEIDSTEVIGDEHQPRQTLTSMRTTLNFMGPAITGAIIPVEVNLEYTYPFAGKNIPIATQIIAITTALYLR